MAAVAGDDVSAAARASIPAPCFTVRLPLAHAPYPYFKTPLLALILAHQRERGLDVAKFGDVASQESFLSLRG